MRACVLRAVLGSALFLASIFGMAACAGAPVPRIGITLSPLCIVLPPGGTQQFDADIFIDEVDQGVDNNAVTWSVLGGNVNGTVTNSGFFTAPNTIPPPAPQVQVIATSIEDNQKSGQATVLIMATPNPSPNPCAAPTP